MSAPTATDKLVSKAQGKASKCHGNASRLVQNTVSNFAGQVVVTALVFFATPYITHQLGPSQYGALSLLMTYLTAFSLLNLGMNASLVKFLAELLPSKQTGEIQQYLSTALTVFTVIGVVIALVIVALAGTIVRHLFKGADVFASSAVLALRIASVGFVVQFLVQVASSIPTAVQRFGIINLVAAGSQALRIIITVILLALGFGLPSLLATVLFCSSCGFLAYALASKRLMPALNLVPGFSRNHFRSLLGHSKYVLVVNVSGQLVASADTFLIGAFLPIANLAYYSVAYTLAQRLWSFGANLISVVFPAASTFAGAQREDDVRELYLRGMKVAAAALCFPALCLCLFSRTFLLFWLGPDYAREGGIVLSLLALGFLANSFTYVPYQVLQATRYAGMAAKAATVYTVLNLTLFVLLIPQFGIVGAATAFSLAQMIFVPWFVHKSNHVVHVRCRTLIASSYARVFAAAAVPLLLCWISRSLITSFFSLAGIIAAGFFIYLILCAIFVCDTRERNACRAVLQRWAPFLGMRMLVPERRGIR